MGLWGAWDDLGEACMGSKMAMGWEGDKYSERTDRGTDVSVGRKE